MTKLSSARHEIAHRYPQFLSDGRHFIYWVWSALEENTGIYAGSLDLKEKLPEGPLVRTWREARFVEPGYLLFLQGSRLVAQRFDTARLQLTAEQLSLSGTCRVALGKYRTGHVLGFSARCVSVPGSSAAARSTIYLEGSCGKATSLY